MESFMIVALALSSLTAPASGDKGTSKARSCSDIRQFYDGKGFPLDGVPQSEISGKIQLAESRLCAPSSGVNPVVAHEFHNTFIINK